MAGETAQEAREIRRLRDTFGTEVVLLGDNDESVVYHVLYEFSWNGRDYAALQPEFGDDDEPLFFRVGRGERGEPELESIDDEDEWETVSEIYDEWSFPAQDD